MKEYINGTFVGERALFASRGISVRGSVFKDGESPLKHGEELLLRDCDFEWKYPLWYCRDVRLFDVRFSETARSGIWYTDGIIAEECNISAPKTFRRSSGICLKRVRLPFAQETMWSCKNIELESVTVVGDYFGMNCEDVRADGLFVDGNYIFDGGKNIEIRNARLMSKDAFWNCENVTVYDSLIVGEYLGWNSKNVRFVNCDIESDQGMCYMDGVVLENCRLKNTVLAFEYSRVEADIRSSVDSIKNPISGRICCRGVGELIMEPERIDTALTEIVIEGESADV